MQSTPESRRRNRHSFTRALSKICTKLDARSEFGISWESRYSGKHQSRFRAANLWVVGSYARGAPTCGDLDLVLELTVLSGRRPPDESMRRVAIGSAPDVRAYVGTPEENASGASFMEAKLIWSGTGCSWQAAIGGIEIRPDAARYGRETDSIPLRAEQLHATPESREHLIDLQRKSVIAWDFVPLAEVNEPGALTKDQEHLLRCMDQHGVKTRAMMPALITAFRELERGGAWSIEQRGFYKCGGAAVYVGQPPVYTHLLDALEWSSIALVPHRSRRGPNGIWLIKRGNQHPIEKLFADRGAFFFTEQGQAHYGIESSTNGYTEATFLDMFRSKKEAVREARWLKDELEITVEVAYATGSRLLDLLSRADLLNLGMRRIALTHVATLLTETENYVTRWADESANTARRLASLFPRARAKI